MRGRKEGLEQGLAEGLEGMRAALRTILQVRGLVVDDRIRAQITACSDIDELRRLIDQAATIATAVELFSAGT